jgi:GR25 family glycosyltransferase involved in LPS biosynthesis
MKINKSYIIYGSIALVILIVIYFILNISFSKPAIQSAHAMNLDKDRKRWESLMKSAASAGLPIERWPATYGKDIPYEDFSKLGVGHALVRPDRNDKKHERLVNLGVVGCFISTRRLLTHLSEQPFSNSAGHLILDDDIEIPQDFLQVWEEKRQLIPADWDIIYLGIWNITGTDVAPGVKKLRSGRHGEKEPNVGTFAYVVRHGAIKTKILPWLRYMFDAIDEQYVHKFDEWNVYGIEPNMIKVNDELQKASSINEINT